MSVVEAADLQPRARTRSPLSADTTQGICAMCGPKESWDRKFPDKNQKNEPGIPDKSLHRQDHRRRARGERFKEVSCPRGRDELVDGDGPFGDVAVPPERKGTQTKGSGKLRE